MKAMLTTILLSVLALTSASALNFMSVDNDVRISMTPGASEAGNGLINIHEARLAGISDKSFNDADINGDGQLTPTEFKTLK